MKERILTNWNFTRVLYLLFGGVVVIQSLTSGEWLVALFGAYFAAMGMFGFGCASGSCVNVNRVDQPGHGSETPVSDVKFEEIKSSKNG